MANLEKAQHDLLLIITTALFILFTTGLEVTAGGPEEPMVIP